MDNKHNIECYVMSCGCGDENCKSEIVVLKTANTFWISIKEGDSIMLDVERAIKLYELLGKFVFTGGE